MQNYTPYKSSCNSKSIEADKLKSELSKLTVKTEKRIIFQVQIGFNKYNVYFTNSYYRFDSNFIRFSLFILSTKGVKPYLCRIKSNFAPDMTQVKMKIMSWKNGLLLSAVSYVFYLVMWFILDDKTIDQLPGMTIADYMVDFLLCMLFTYISLGFCFLVFRVLPFRTSYVWGMVYASCLMALNNIVAFGMITLFNFLWDETDNGLLDELLNMKGAYTFAMISTLPVKRLCQLLLRFSLTSRCATRNKHSKWR